MAGRKIRTSLEESSESSDEEFYAGFKPMLLFEAKVAVTYPRGMWKLVTVTTDFNLDKIFEEQALELVKSTPAGFPALAAKVLSKTIRNQV